MSKALFDLAGRKALITGAGRGLGRAMALALARAGADVAVFDLDETGAKKTAEEIAGLGRCSLAIRGDVTDVDQVDEAVGKIVDGWKRIDILINNAGINIRQPILELETEVFDKVHEINFKGVFHFSKRVAGEMIKQNYGKIINIASITGMKIMRGLEMSPYYTTKAGVIQFTKASATEWAKYGIRVNSISPGWFITDINRHLWEDPEYTRMRQDQTPLGRIGEPDDLAGTVVFLAAPASDFITGQNIAVDGGFTVW